jgi:hypothetical protein
MFEADVGNTTEEEIIMMKRIACSLVVLVAFSMALTGFALAQQFDYRVEANLPVDFYAGDQHLPAGTYLFAVNYGDHAVTMRNQATGRTAVVLASPVVNASPGYDNRNKSAQVELRSVGGRYVLAEVQGRSSGVEFPVQRTSTLASAESERTITVVASLR